MKEYLRELADQKARESSQKLLDIKNGLKGPLTPIKEYCAYVTELEACRVRKEEVFEQKKKLDEMKGVLSKYKSKDEGGYGGGSSNLAQLQSKIEGLATDLQEVEELLQRAGDAVKEHEEANAQELADKVLEEQQKVQALSAKIKDSEALTKAATPASEALAEAARYKQRFDKSVEALARFQAY